MIDIVEESFVENDDSFIVNGEFYFNYHLFKPEVSGFYEVLFKRDSATAYSVKNGVMKPYLYYNVESGIWYIDNNRRILDNIIIGWRDHLTELE